MMALCAVAVWLVAWAGQPLGPGDHLRKIEVDGKARSYLVHVPPTYEAGRATPVVLVLHGAGQNAERCVSFTGMSAKSDEAGFVAVYPNGTGVGRLKVFNAGMLGRADKSRADDVRYISRLLDDLSTVVHVDRRRVYATGMSNGGMMCYRLAAELSDRIAAIAPVAGTMAVETAAPRRPVPVLHFHGTEDRLVPFHGLPGSAPRLVRFKSVEETLRVWRRINGCPETPVIASLPDIKEDGTSVTKRTYGPGKAGAEVILVVIQGGGHTWPGRKPPLRFLGRTTSDMSANDLIWDFFVKHPMR